MPLPSRRRSRPQGRKRWDEGPEARTHFFRCRALTSASIESDLSHLPESSMAADHIRYDILAQEALRGMVRQVLADVARKGLLGEHHFYIRFDTHAPGVRISS